MIVVRRPLPEDFGNFLSIDNASQQFVSERMKTSTNGWMREKEKMSEWESDRDEREGEKERGRGLKIYTILHEKKKPEQFFKF